MPALRAARLAGMNSLRCGGVSAPRVFSIEEANATVPRLAALMERLQRSALALAREREAWMAATGLDGVEPEVLLRDCVPARTAAEALAGVMAEIEGLGVALKDPEIGLVDFPSRRGDEDVLLCWQYGEPEVAFWHGADEGFRGRKPIGGARARAPIQ